MNPTLLLIGDSILDNAYWNDVGKDTTAEVLRKMNINVIDRTTEEVAAKTFFRENKGIPVGGHYVEARENKGIPYDGNILQGKYYVKPIPEKTNKKWWDTPKKHRYAALSLGGNDLALYSNMDIEDILQTVSKVIKNVIKNADILPKNFIYIIPYPPNNYISQMIQKGFRNAGVNISPQKFYKSMVDNGKIMCNKLDIKCLSLEDFTLVDKGPENSIPEPTKEGAFKIALRISSIIVAPEQLIMEFCNSPIIDNFRKIPMYLQNFLLEIAKFCVINQIGNIKLAKKIQNFIIY